MITLIHGSDVSASYLKLQEFTAQKDNYEIIRLEGNKLTLTELVTTIEAPSMFFSQKRIIILGLLKGLLTKARLELLDYLKKQEEDLEIVLWENMEVEKIKINKYLSSARNILCNFPPLLFKFLDNIGASANRLILEQFQELRKQKDAEIIYFLLLRQWRNLIIARDLGAQGFVQIPSWQAVKFIRQANYFTIDSLINSYRQLLQIDYQIKTNSTPFNLGQLLDIFFINL